MKPLALNSYYSQVIVGYQVHYCTKNACFIKSKHFSCSACSLLTGADVRRGGWGFVKCGQGVGVKNGHFADVLYGQPQTALPIW